MSIKPMQPVETAASGIPFSEAKQDQIFATVAKFLAPFSFKEVAQTLIRSTKAPNFYGASQSNLLCYNKAKIGEAKAALAAKLAKSGFSEPQEFKSGRTSATVWERKNISILIGTHRDGSGIAKVRLHRDPSMSLGSRSYLRSEFGL